MPDYSLPKMQNQSSNSPQLPPQNMRNQSINSQQSQSQHIQNQSLQQPHFQNSNPLDQLGDMSQRRKMETENAMLREALAMSSENCERLTKQFNLLQAETQKILQQIEHNRQADSKKHASQITELQTAVNQMLTADQTLQSSLEKNLSAMTDKITKAVSSDTNTAINALYEKMNSSVSRLEKYDSTLKTNLEAGRKKYTEGLNKLFRVDDKRHKIFFFGMYSNIMSLILLIVVLLIFLRG